MASVWTLRRRSAPPMAAAPPSANRFVGGVEQAARHRVNPRQLARRALNMSPPAEVLYNGRWLATSLHRTPGGVASPHRVPLTRHTDVEVHPMRPSLGVLAAVVACLAWATPSAAHH